MEAGAAVVGGAALAVLGGLWVLATRRHRSRRSLRDADWPLDESPGGMWASGARCPQCQSSTGVLDESDGQLWFDCLNCGERHKRVHRG